MPSSTVEAKTVVDARSHEQKFLLPLLYSTFSARKAITEQQLHAVQAITSKLKSIRANKKIYRQTPTPVRDAARVVSGDSSLRPAGADQKPDQEDAGSHSSLKEGGKLAESLLIEELTEDDSPANRQLVPHAKQSTDERPVALSFLVTPDTKHPSKMTILAEKLDELELCMDATSTTRTSLLSTVSAFTSQLNSQAFQFATRTRGGYGSSVGLSSLDQNLAKAGAKVDGPGAGGKEEEGAVSVEDIKKEIRGLKGLLLSRYVRCFHLHFGFPLTLRSCVMSGAIFPT